MKAYLAGPMRGIENYNHPAFNEAAEWLRNVNRWEVFNPAEDDINYGFDAASEPSLKEVQGAFRRDFSALSDSEAIVLLSGWPGSSGARAEVEVARLCGLQVYEFHPHPNGGFKCIPVEWRAIQSFIRCVETELGITIETDKKPENILQEAESLVYGDRHDDYGHPADDFERTVGAIYALMPDLFTRKPLPSDWAKMMVCCKLSRMHASPDKRDHAADAAGYADTYWRCRERETLS